MPLLVNAARCELRLEDEDDFDHALIIPDLDDAKVSVLTQEKAGVVGFVHAIYSVARLAGIPLNEENEPAMIRERPLQFRPYPRIAVMNDLSAMAGADLFVSDSFKMRHLPRTVKGSNGFRYMPEDRYVATNVYKTGAKDGADVLVSPFLMIEIDDYAVIQEIDDALSWGAGVDVSPVILALIEKQARIAQRAVSWLVPKDFEVPPPFYACYSGFKSIHFLYRFDEPLEPKERVACAESASDLASKFKDMKARDLPMTQEQIDFQTIDPQPLFSPTAMVRVPCDACEWSDKHARFRHPQVAWQVTDHPTDMLFETLPRVGLMQRAKTRIQERMDRLYTLKRYTYTPRAERQGFHKVTREEVEGALGKG